MSARFASLPPTRNARPLFGVTALLIGICIFVSALHGHDGAWDHAVSAMPQACTAYCDGRQHRSLSGMEARLPVDAEHENLSSGRRNERSSYSEAAASAPSAVATATAQWTADWYRAVSSDGARPNLVSSASRWTIRWRRAILAWDDESGYGAVEANRATATARVDGLAGSGAAVDSAQNPGRDGIGSTMLACSESAMCPRQHESRTWLLQSGSWSREQRESGVRSSSLIWTTPTLVGADLSGVAMRP